MRKMKTGMNMKKRAMCMIFTLVIVLFLFWFLFMRRREGFLKGAASKSSVLSGIVSGGKNSMPATQTNSTSKVTLAYAQNIRPAATPTTTAAATHH